MNRQKKIAGGFTAAAAGALLILLPFLKTHEGLSLKSYLDAARVYTICYGHAYVEPNVVMTKAQCDELLKSDAYVYMKAVYDAMTYEPNPFVLAAHTSFAYNIGLAGKDSKTGKCKGYRCSVALQRTNEGDAQAGCKAIAGWYTSDGMDCRVDTRCRGVWNRRQDEIKLCMEGAQ